MRRLALLVAASALFVFPARVLAAESGTVTAPTPEGRQEGTDDTTLQRLDELLREKPRDLGARRARGLALERRGDYEGAARDLRRYLLDRPEDIHAHEARGRALFQLGRTLQARLCFDEALELDPDNLDARGWRGACNVALGRPQRALEDLELVVDAPGIAPEYEIWLIDALIASGDRPAARARLEARIADHGHPDDIARLVALDAEPHAEDASPEGIAADEHEEGGAGDVDTELEFDSDDWRALGLMALCWLGLLSLVALFMTPSALQRIELPLKGGTHPRYDGPAGELLALYLQNVVLTLVTLGVYRFWAKTHAQRFHYQHLSFARERFDYHATGGERFAGFLKGLLLLVPIIGAVYFEYRVLVDDLGEERAYLVSFWSFFLLMALLRPIVLVGAQRFNLARTTWSNLRFRFTGRVGAAYKLYLVGYLRILMTLGIYAAWHTVNVQRFKRRHAAMGELRFDFRGTGGELFWLNVFGLPLSYVSLGLALPWYIAARERFFISNTYFNGRRFHSRLDGAMVFAVLVPSLLAIVCTLGLALPWAVTRWRRMLTHTTHYAGVLDPDQVQSIRDSSTSGTAEGLGEAGEVFGEIGELFGV